LEEINVEEPKIGISVGDDTEKLLGELLRLVDDKMLDDLEIDRVLEDSKGLTGEPITIGAVISGSAIALSAVLRLIERHLEHTQQRKIMEIVAEGFTSDHQLGNALTQIAKKNADVSISYGIAKEAWTIRRK
jgi:hypothetical protein